MEITFTKSERSQYLGRVGEIDACHRVVMERVIAAIEGQGLSPEARFIKRHLMLNRWEQATNEATYYRRAFREFWGGNPWRKQAQEVLAAARRGDPNPWIAPK